MRRRRATNDRPGTESFTLSLHDALPIFGLQLPGMPVAEIQAALDQMGRLQPLVDVLQRNLKIGAHAQFVAESDAWRGATSIYTTLARMAKDNPEVADAIRTAVEFFATRK